MKMRILLHRHYARRLLITLVKIDIVHRYRSIYTLTNHMGEIIVWKNMKRRLILGAIGKSAYRPIPVSWESAISVARSNLWSSSTAHECARLNWPYATMGSLIW